MRGNLKGTLVGVLLVGGLLAGCGSSSSADADKATTTTTVALGTDLVARDRATGPLADTSILVTEKESACVQGKADMQEAFGCLSKATLLVNERLYLEGETEATPKQVDCVLAKLDAMELDEARRVSLSGIGQAAYVPGRAADLNAQAVNRAA
jgi:hypothetical protein